MRREKSTVTNMCSFKTTSPCSNHSEFTTFVDGQRMLFETLQSATLQYAGRTAGAFLRSCHFRLVVERVDDLLAVCV